MKHQRRWLAHSGSLPCIAAVALWSACPFVVNAAPLCPAKLRVGFLDYELAPLVLGNAPETLTPTGKAVDWLKRAVVRTGCKPDLELERLPIRRGRAMLFAGEIDVWAMSLASTELVEKAALPMSNGQPDVRLGYFKTNYSFYVLRSETRVTWDGTTLVGPRDFKLGIAPIDALRELASSKGWAVETGLGTQNVLAKLLAGRYPVAILPEVALNSQPPAVLGRLRKLEPFAVELWFHAPVSKAFAAAYPAFTQAFWFELCTEGRTEYKYTTSCRR